MTSAILRDESIFWARLAGMPPVEAEAELMLRKEHLAHELASLQRQKHTHARLGRRTEASAVGVEMLALNKQLAVINGRVKELHKLQDRTSWRRAVQALYGQEGVEACTVWIEQHVQGAQPR